MIPSEWARLNSIAREILRLFHWFKKRGMGIFMSQGEIARRCRCCRATVNRWIDRLCERGFIERAKRTPRFWLYVLVTTPVTSGVTSQHPYPSPNPLELRERKPVSFERLSERERRAIARATPIGGRREPIPLSWEEAREVEAILRGGRMAATA